MSTEDLSGDRWIRSGISLLWDVNSLLEISQPESIVSVRHLFQIAQAGWPEELPCTEGDALIIAGLEGCIDALPPEEVIQWMEDRLYSLLLSFQQEYQGQAALIFWLPEALKRLSYDEAKEVYFWECTAEFKGQQIPIGRCLWNGAEQDVRRIIKKVNQDFIGLFHPRIS